MDSSSWQRVRATFERLLALPPVERGAALDAEFTAAETELRAEVERMLAVDAEADADSFLTPPGDQTLHEAMGTPLRATEVAAPGTRIGSFEITRVIAAGGMGVVCEAVQDAPHRTVALKMIRPELVSESMLQRFNHEIELLARLQHPGIAQIHEAGVTPVEGHAAGMPWFAMELLVDARPITEYVRDARLSTEAILELFEDVCAAVQHGHQRGVIHRDLKPANILVDGEGRAKVIDFGIARATEVDTATAAGVTRAGDLVGTLPYMSPEQLTGTTADLDVRSDVYSMGVVLFELLAGAHPFPVAGRSLVDICAASRHREPPALSTQSTGHPIELDWILLKALATEVDRRYASMAEFAADLRRMRTHEPVSAGPPSGTYRVRKFIRRHRIAVGVTALVVLLVLTGLISTTLAMLRAEVAEKSANEQREVAIDERNRAIAAAEFLAEVFSRANPAKDAREVSMAEGLDLCARMFRARFGDQPETLAMLAHMLGQTYRGIGMKAEAEEYLTEAREAYRGIHGEQHLRTAKVMADLVVLRLEEGELDAAEALIDTAMPVLEKELGANAEETLTLAFQRVDLLRQRGKSKIAESALRDLITTMQRELGATARRTLLAKNLLAGMLQGRRDLVAAEPLYQEALAGLGKLQGEDHPDTVSIRFNLATLMFLRGKRKECVPMMKEVLDANLRVLGENHRYTMRARTVYGAMLQVTGKIDAAASQYTAALAIAKELKLKPSSRDVQGLMSNIGRIERDRGNYAKAEPIIRELWTIRRQQGPDLDNTLISHSEMASVQYNLKRFDEAVKLFRSGLTLAAKRRPAEHPTCYKFRLGLGRSLIATKDYAAAERALLTCHEHYTAAVKGAAVKGQIAPAAPLLVQLYVAWGKPAQADKYR